MSSSIDKAELYFWEQNGYSKKINSSLSPIQACNIINHLILNHDFSEEELGELEILKEWIKNKGL